MLVASKDIKPHEPIIMDSQSLKKFPVQDSFNGKPFQNKDLDQLGMTFLPHSEFNSIDIERFFKHYDILNDSFCKNNE